MAPTKFATHTTAAVVIGGLCLAVGGVGIADAANGGSLVLGQPNAASSTTSLSNNRGTPLALVAKPGKPPLKVNSSGLVKHLNAAEVGGKTAAQLAPSGSAAELKFVINGNDLPKTIVLPDAPTGTAGVVLRPVRIVSTAALTPGRYLVTGQVTGDNALCWVDTAPNTNAAHNFAFVGNNGSTAPIITTVTVTKKRRINEYCSSQDPNNAEAAAQIVGASIVALKTGSLSTGTARKPVTPALRK